MPYQLKKGQETFQAMDGPFAYHTFKKGVIYEDVPPEEKHRFEKMGTPKTKAVPSPKTAAIKPVGDGKLYAADQKGGDDQ
jgi:hypothetical protein